jgi:hypothetical protein
MPAPKNYDVETQVRAVRMYADRIAEGDVSHLAARKDVGELLGINPDTLRYRVRRNPGARMPCWRLVSRWRPRTRGCGPTAAAAE